MKLKIIIIISTLLVISPVQAWNANRPTRAEAGLPGRPELPSGSYFDDPDVTGCTLGGMWPSYVSCFSRNNLLSGYWFNDPFIKCPQNGCYDLTTKNCPSEKVFDAAHPSKPQSKGICCFDLCNQRVVKD